MTTVTGFDVISSLEATFVSNNQRGGEVRLLFLDKRIDRSRDLTDDDLPRKAQIFTTQSLFSNQVISSPCQKLFTVYASAFSRFLCAAFGRGLASARAPHIVSALKCICSIS